MRGSGVACVKTVCRGGQRELLDLKIVGPRPTFYLKVLVTGDKMRQAPDELYEIITPVIERLGYELVGLDFRPQPGKGLLRVYIDAPGGVTVDDCERVSHQVSGLLDVEDPIHGPYILEVSSPGLDRPLFTREHFSRFVGRRVKVQLHLLLDGRRNYTGVLHGLRHDEVVIEEDGRMVALPLDKIAKANLVPEL